MNVLFKPGHHSIAKPCYQCCSVAVLGIAARKKKFLVEMAETTIKLLT